MTRQKPPGGGGHLPERVRSVAVRRASEATPAAAVLPDVARHLGTLKEVVAAALAAARARQADPEREGVPPRDIESLAAALNRVYRLEREIHADLLADMSLKSDDELVALAETPDDE